MYPQDGNGCQGNCDQIRAILERSGKHIVGFDHRDTGITTGKIAAGQMLRKIAGDKGDSSDARPPVFSEKLQPLLRFSVLVLMGLCTAVFFDHLIRAVGQLDRTILNILGPSLMQHMPFRPSSSTANGSPSLDPLASKNLLPAQTAVLARQMAADRTTLLQLCLYVFISVYPCVLLHPVLLVFSFF